MRGAGGVLAGLLERRPADVDFGVTYRQPCGALDAGTTPTRLAGETYCDGERHYVGRGPATSWCPEALRREVDARVAAERKRLEQLLRRIHRESGSVGFTGFDPRDEADRQLRAALIAFAEGRPPKRGVWVFGPTGRGKTRLMLAAHFALLRGGARSVYATPGTVRDWLADDGSEGPAWLAALRSADVVVFDDFGTAGDERFRGTFADSLKRILDESGAVWATATNLPAAALAKHPDCNEQILSRLMSGASVVNLPATAPDWRTRAR